MGGEHKYKDSDGPFLSFEAQNKNDLLVFTDKQQVYKARISDFEDAKASSLGAYLPAALGMDEGENAIYLLDPGDYSGHIIFFFKNGKAARVELSAYSTKTNRKKLTGGYSDKSPVCSMLMLSGDIEIAAYSNDGRAVVFSTALLAPKATRSAQGVQVMSLKRGRVLEKAAPLEQTLIAAPARYRVRVIPASGAILKPEDRGEEQLELF